MRPVRPNFGSSVLERSPVPGGGPVVLIVRNEKSIGAAVVRMCERLRRDRVSYPPVVQSGCLWAIVVVLVRDSATHARPHREAPATVLAHGFVGLRRRE